MASAGRAALVPRQTTVVQSRLKLTRLRGVLTRSELPVQLSFNAEQYTGAKSLLNGRESTMRAFSTLIIVVILSGCASAPATCPNPGVLTGCAFSSPVSGSGSASTAGSSPSTTTPVSMESNHPIYVPQQPGGIDRYGMDQATGPVINGVHHGTPAGPPKTTCHGAILNGQCTGPEF